MNVMISRIAGGLSDERDAETVRQLLDTLRQVLAEAETGSAWVSHDLFGRVAAAVARAQAVER